MAEDYIDVYQAAEELGVTRMTLYRLLNQYDISRFKRPGNRRTLLKRSDLAALRVPRERPRPERTRRARRDGEEG